jgi:hypothetical protein
MSDDLMVSIHDRLRSVSTADWQRLFPSHPDSPELLDLIQSSGMDDFAFHSIVVRQGGRPILLLPIFQTTLNLANVLDGIVRTFVRLFAPLFPSLLKPRVLGIGFVEGEWGAIGLDPHLDVQSKADAWELAQVALSTVRRRSKADLTLCLNLTPAAARELPDRLRARLCEVDTLPCGQLQLPFSNVEDYLASLSKSTRKDLRRKLKESSGIGILHTREPHQWMEAIYSLYTATVARADLSLGMHRKSFFDQICQRIPNAEYVLYFHGEKLIAFNLLIASPTVLIDKYFCMDPILGRRFNLYFVSWIQNVRYCIANDIKLYHAGPGAEATKSRLGARFIPSLTFFQHRNPLIHALLVQLKGLLAYTPSVELNDQASIELPPAPVLASSIAP